MRIYRLDNGNLQFLSSHLSRGKIEFQALLPYVENIINTVKQKGDVALFEYARQFDKAVLTPETIRVTKDEMELAYSVISEDQLATLEFAAKNIREFHKKQLSKNWKTTIIEGVTLGQKIQPYPSIGVYAPGGKAQYSSSILMCAIPAKVAGVQKIVVCSPLQGNQSFNPTFLVSADIAGVTSIYKIGGVQAIAAMAYGTETIPKVTKIVGPGNSYVTAAKIAVSKDIAIDLPAGPSEIMVLADNTANPIYVAADILAQLEHDTKAIAILVSLSEDLVEAVIKELERQINLLLKKDEINVTLQERGFIFMMKNIESAIDVINEFAPEHLSIQTKDSTEILGKIQNAGAIFLGNYTPVTFGDYTAGLNHVLPTAGYAKLYSGLSIRDFYKTMNFMQCTKDGFRNLQKQTITFAEMEGLEAHAKSVTIRAEGDEK